MMSPKISIITPNFNQGKYIEETIISVINQDYPNLEYIIIDGGSTDESVEIIKKYEKHLTYWISEPDKGQADAINKGLAHCTGDLFNWINSDDILAVNALKTISELYKPGLTIAGKVFNFYPENPALNDFTQNSNLTHNEFLNLKSTYHQPGIWVNLHDTKSFGLDIKSHYYFDFFFYVNYLKKNTEISYTDKVLANFRVHAESKTSLIQEKSKEEIVSFYKNLYQSEKDKSIKVIIKRVLNYWLALEQIKLWQAHEPSFKNSINFVKFISFNFKYMKVNVFWKFVLKYTINYKGLRG
ncbi:glycosyltransferase family 2 protein [Pedobacter alpinus]|uniref:Glycosyltransferase family 2 protein n=1 Tax=Pedobacter alpinus TaxID=1590643 RepID=A0ABW5TP55_9SPHI